MNVLLINTYPHGGAGNACKRLQKALQGRGVDAPLLTTEDAGLRWPFYAERLSFLPYEKDKSVRFSFSLANFGKDLHKHPLVEAADVLHLHWINQGLLSLDGIKALAALGKPIVWTLHDMWVFTGGCHYSGDCKHYKSNCGNCWYLKDPAPNDLSNKIWNRKKNTLPTNIQYVTCSKWLADMALSSGLLRQSKVTAIPNPIDTDLFKPLNRAARALQHTTWGVDEGSLVLLFVAMNIKEHRKGFSYLLEALKILKSKTDQLPIEIVVMGQSDPEALAMLPYKTHALGLIKDESAIRRVYASADVFVIPSLEDNLPNTVMESLACGTPVVGFDTGGIPEMVGHGKEGIIAPQRDAHALANGIYTILSDKSRREVMQVAALVKVAENYEQGVVAERYMGLYEANLAAL